DGPADVARVNRRAVAVGNDDVVVVVRLGQLIVGDDGEALLLAEQRALGHVGRGTGERGTHVLQCELVRLQLGRIDLDANGRLLLPANGDRGDAGNLRNLLGDDVL